MKSTNIYDPDRLSLDRELLRQFYLKNGYADIRILAATADLDRDGRLTYSSEGVHTLLGYAPEAVVGRSELDLLYDAGSRRRAQQLLVRRQTALTGWQDVGLTWMHQDGRPVRLTGSAVVVRDNKGRLAGFRGARRPVGETRDSHDLQYYNICNTVRS